MFHGEIHLNGAVDTVICCGKSLVNGLRHYQSNFAKPLLGSTGTGRSCLRGHPAGGKTTSL
uniref:RxLR effector candidate protein n=1 Tax=Hyaloperonospora arabidopsidis (strain Emoy2) TaxID=559515 RepID=M4BXC7_HYAAE